MFSNHIRSNDDLLDYLNKGNSVEYLFFYGHSVPKDGSVSRTCLSQWYPAKFEIDDVVYPTAEHYMMAQKAQLFEDEKSFEKIIAAKSPRDAKKFGRGVKGFDDEVWKKHRFDYVVQGNRHKFSQNNGLRVFLLITKDTVIVEASPKDRIWGIGMSENHKDVYSPKNWRGSNLLGYALMEVRDILTGCN